jgi:heme exporter protein C
MTFVALWTGALWGKPTWGTWWVWDARLTSELLLLFLYLGFMALQAAHRRPAPRRPRRRHAGAGGRGQRADHLLLGEVVEHAAPGRHVSLTKAPSMASMMLAGMLLMVVAFWAYSIAAALHRCAPSSWNARSGADWVAALPEAPAMNWSSLGRVRWPWAATRCTCGARSG